jgi:hypothetical protein
MFGDAIMVQEILGLLEDMLNDLTIKNNTYSGLKTIQHLLNELLYFKSTLNRVPSSRQIKTVNSSLNKLNNICGFDKTSFESDDVDATPFMEKDENVGSSSLSAHQFECFSFGFFKKGKKPSQYTKVDQTHVNYCLVDHNICKWHAHSGFAAIQTTQC